jgi:hypothetical protein
MLTMRETIAASKGNGTLEIHFPIGSLCINSMRNDYPILIIGHNGGYSATVLKNDKHIQISLYALLINWEKV